MNPIKLEDRFRGHENDVSRDSFWFTYFAMANPCDRGGIYNNYFNSAEISSEKVEMYCDMWKKCRWN